MFAVMTESERRQGGAEVAVLTPGDNEFASTDVDVEEERSWFACGPDEWGAGALGTRADGRRRADNEDEEEDFDEFEDDDDDADVDDDEEFEEDFDDDDDFDDEFEYEESDD
ncbi:MAG: hypothetical protein JXO22_04125 [Phycisphaerae bacterium]|nr:hypothetical protein [Phycisphaerae bacterium]